LIYGRTRQEDYIYRSPAVGWKLKEQSGKKRITLELGGNAGVIVHRDADLSAAIPAIAMGGFGQAGQSCISVQRVIVEESVYDDFRERFVAHVREKNKDGDPRQRATIVGPLISANALQETEGRLAAAIAAGAKVVHGGKTMANVWKRPCWRMSIHPSTFVGRKCSPDRYIASLRDFDNAPAIRQ
jgi:glyceraldehyde-3-phosphate dehydrogenase (NADP+)